MNNYTMGLVKQRQDPLRERYRSVPQEAWIVDGATTTPVGAEDAFHSSVVPGKGYDLLWRVGIHRAVGGYHDLPNPGDILCAALASCFESTLRMIADRFEIPIAFLEVDVQAEVDVRGTLLVDREVPVGFQRMSCRVRLEPEFNLPADKIKMLLAAAEHSCVVLQTLRKGVPVQVQLGGNQTAAAASAAAE